MHISYKPLWHTLVERNMRKEDLRIAAGLTTNMIANMGKGKNISMETLVRICEALNCGILDVIELEQDKDAEKLNRQGRRCEMDNREKIIRLWFDMWLAKKDLGIFNVFSDNAVYIESWGPEYHGSKKIKLWFEEWNTRGTVLQWDIKQFFHKGNQTIVEWYFKNKMDAGNVEAFDGMSLIEWTPDGKIALLKEFGCNENRYDPYKDGNIPHFRDENAKWF